MGRALSWHPRLRIVDVAIADTAGSAVLHVTRADDSSSLLPSTDFQATTVPGTVKVGELTVTTNRLDALFDPAELQRPVLLKIDVQGTELQVLRGAGALLDTIDTILVECSFQILYEGQALADDAISLMHSHGYRLASVVSPTTDAHGRLIQADLVFERRALPTAPPG